MGCAVQLLTPSNDLIRHRLKLGLLHETTQNSTATAAPDELAEPVSSSWPAVVRCEEAVADHCREHFLDHSSDVLSARGV